MKKRINRLFVGIILGSVLGIVGCEKDNNKDAPQLPPESAFVIDFNDFQNNTKSTQTYENWAVAVITAGVWNTVLAVTLAVPVATYVEALNQEPVRVDNDTWKWSFSVTVASVIYTAELLADVSGSTVDWRMYISQQGGFSNFLWFKGTCDILRTHGEWTLYLGPLNNKEFLQIEWNHDWENQTGDILYTNILTGTDGAGDYVHYGITLDSPFNVYYDIYDKSEDNLIKINYSTGTKEGSIYYNNLWHCWDNNYMDIECSAR